MNEMSTEKPFRLAFFDTVDQADQAARQLLAAGFSKREIAVVCPDQFKDHFAGQVPLAERPGSHAVQAILEGGAVGAAIGGIALAATAITTGGVGLLPAVGVLIGGGALAGGFSSLILADGYGKEIGQNYLEAVRLGKIAVGVEVEGERNGERLDEAQGILLACGGHLPSTGAEAIPEQTNA